MVGETCRKNKRPRAVADDSPCCPPRPACDRRHESRRSLETRFNWLLDAVVAKPDARTTKAKRAQRQMTIRPNRVFELVRAIFRWTVGRGDMRVDPTIGMSPPIKGRGRASESLPRLKYVPFGLPSTRPRCSESRGDDVRANCQCGAGQRSLYNSPSLPASALVRSPDYRLPNWSWTVPSLRGEYPARAQRMESPTGPLSPILCGLSPKLESWPAAVRGSFQAPMGLNLLRDTPPPGRLNVPVRCWNSRSPDA